MCKVLLYLLILISFSAIAQKGYLKNLEVGIAYFEVKQYSKAIYYLDKSWYGKNNIKASRYLVDSYLSLRDFDNAYRWQRKKVALTKESKDQLKLVSILKLLGEYKKALAYLGKLSLSKKDSSIYMELTTSIDSALIWLNHPTSYKVKNLESVNSVYSEIAASSYEDGIIFSSNREGIIVKPKDQKDGLNYYDLFIAKKKGEKFRSTELFAAKINSPDHEVATCFSSDGTEVYFTRGQFQEDKNRNRMKLFRSEKKNIGWSAPEEFILNDSLFSFAHPSISEDQRFFFFTSDLPGGYGGFDLYVCVKNEKGNWSSPINLGKEVNTSDNELYPWYDSEKRALYFTSSGHIGMGGYDLFKTTINNGEWGKVENLHYPINSSADDFSIVFDLSENVGYLSSNRKGGKGKEDIYLIYK